MCFFFFFFQAEDGIRDWSVTGVQTCALPICRGEESPGLLGVVRVVLRPVAELVKRDRPLPERRRHRRVHRSEERRVGKECRSRWGQYRLKKKVKDSGNARRKKTETQKGER